MLNLKQESRYDVKVVGRMLLSMVAAFAVTIIVLSNVSNAQELDDFPVKRGDVPAVNFPEVVPENTTPSLDPDAEGNKGICIDEMFTVYKRFPHLSRDLEDFAPLQREVYKKRIERYGNINNAEKGNPLVSLDKVQMSKDAKQYYGYRIYPRATDHLIFAIADQEQQTVFENKVSRNFFMPLNKNMSLLILTTTENQKCMIIEHDSENNWNLYHIFDIDLNLAK